MARRRNIKETPSTTPMPMLRDDEVMSEWKSKQVENMQICKECNQTISIPNQVEDPKHGLCADCASQALDQIFEIIPGLMTTPVQTYSLGYFRAWAREHSFDGVPRIHRAPTKRVDFQASIAAGKKC